MVVRQITFVCDVCGTRISFDESDIEGGNDNLSNILPKDWRKMSPYGDVCTRCCNELDGVYERIHAPMKAKEQYENHEKQEKRKQPNSRSWELFLQQG